MHRDVKPGNVLITPQGQVKVTDFGIARAEASEPLTKTGAVLGTATYFSPEQAQGFALDGRSDVYALGVVLYEMLTGVAPFTADSPVSVAYKHVRETPVPPSSIVPDIPARWTTSCSPRWRRTSTLRYPSAQDLRADLLRFERGRPVVGAHDRDGGPRLGARGGAGHARRRRHRARRPRRDASAAGGARPSPSASRSALLVGLIVFLLANSDFGDDGTATPTLNVPRSPASATARPRPGSRPRVHRGALRRRRPRAGTRPGARARTPRAVARSRRAGSSRSR